MMERDELLVAYGDDPARLLPSLFEAADLPGLIPRQARIGIKPNLVLARPSETGATTDPRIVEVLVEYLVRLGCTNLVILESSWLGDSTARAFRVCGYEEIGRRFGVPLLDLKGDATTTRHAHDLTIEVCSQALEVEFLINVPVLKAHCQTGMTCALKNLKGCLPDPEKRRFHTLGLHRPIAALNTMVRTDLVIVDGIIGDLSFEEGGTPVRMDRIIVGRDPVLVDTYVASLMGFAPGEIAYIDLAAEFGVGSNELKRSTIREINAPPAATYVLKAAPQAKDRRIRAEQACSACYSSLLFALQRLETPGGPPAPDEVICIGQGFREQELPHLGIGACTRGFPRHLDGCPPSAREIVSFLRQGKPGARRRS